MSPAKREGLRLLPDRKENKHLKVSGSPTGGQVKLIVGLGNPGVKYAETRHNIGFMVVDVLARKEGFDVNRQRFDSFWGKGEISRVPVILAKPQTFMNLSGVAVASLARYFKVEAGDVIVIHDDMDFPLGDVRLKAGGGTGGHKGLASIASNLGAAGFIRVRLGIGRPAVGVMSERFVLDRFDGDESKKASGAVDRASDAVVDIVSFGVQAAMNRFNMKVTQNLSEEV